MKSLPENFNWESSKDFCWITFLFIWIARWNFLSLKFIIALSLFFSRWHTCNSSGVISWQVKEIALQTVFSRTLPPMLRGIGLITSGNSFRWYWALLKAFYSNWIICWCRRALQFFLSTDQTLTLHVSNRKYQICHLMLLIECWYQITEVALQSVLLWTGHILNLASWEHHDNLNKLLNVKKYLNDACSTAITRWWLLCYIVSEKIVESALMQL